MDKIYRWLGIAAESRLDNQFDCMIDYVDITEEELNFRIDEMEKLMGDVLEKATDLITELKEILEKKKVPTAKKVAKVVAKKAAKGFTKKSK